MRLLMMFFTALTFGSAASAAEKEGDGVRGREPLELFCIVSDGGRVIGPDLVTGIVDDGKETHLAYGIRREKAGYRLVDLTKPRSKDADFLEEVGEIGLIYRDEKQPPSLSVQLLSK